MTTAVIVAAGSSRRMGFDKLAAEIAGVPVLLRSLLAFEACEAVDQIVVVTSPSREEEVRGWSGAPHRLGKLRAVVPGDAERCLSVARGLAGVPSGTKIVAVHDGARPLVTPRAIARCLEAARAGGAAALARRVADTLKRADREGRVIGSVAREDLWSMETPQAFDLLLLRRAYERVSGGERVADEVSAVQALGETVLLVENDAPNPKITVPADIALAEALLAARGAAARG